MNTVTKIVSVAIFGLALAVSMTTTGSAASRRHAAAAIGFGAGVAVGVAAANSYRSGYADEQGYAYDQSYGDYAYESGPRYRYDRNPGSWNSSTCMGSPGSPGYRPCFNQ